MLPPGARQHEAPGRGLSLCLRHAVFVDESQQSLLAYACLEGTEDIAKGARWDSVRTGRDYGDQGSLSNPLCKGQPVSRSPTSFPTVLFEQAY